MRNDTTDGIVSRDSLATILADSGRYGVRSSPLVNGQMDFVHWSEFVADRFVVTIVGSTYAMLLFDGWRTLAAVAAVLMLELYRWRRSPYLTIPSQLLSEVPFDLGARREIVDDWKRHRFTAWWWLALPFVPALAFTLLVVASRDSAPTLLTIGRLVEPLLDVVNGEAVRADLDHLGTLRPYAAAAIAANLLWALAFIVVAYLLCLRGGVGFLSIPGALPTSGRGCRSPVEYAPECRNPGYRRAHRWFCGIFLFGLWVFGDGMIRNLPRRINIYSDPMIYLGIIAVGVIGMGSITSSYFFAKFRLKVLLAAAARG